MKPPALEYRFTAADAWRPMPPEVALIALAPDVIARSGVDEIAPDLVHLFAGRAIASVSASGRGGFIRIAR